MEWFRIFRLIFCTAAFFAVVIASEDEHRLLQDLQKDYDRMARPVENHFDEVNVTVNVMPIQLLNLDIGSQQMELLTWTQLTWNDYRLKWDPRNYSGLAGIRFPSETLWKPDVFLYNR
ncbi:neurotransmitter-gated ion-channel ligand binding domain-containing protein [Ditylenchus destructor]|nr:neurotransmitter-gated ion-channel ligand binding domain-containing protein [Ditylenchus destructor]